MIYEPAISPDRIHGKNLEFIERNIPHIWKLLTNDFGAMIRRSEVVVLLKKLSEQERFELREMRSHQTRIDFVGAIRPCDLQAEAVPFAQPQRASFEAAAGMGQD
jgi:hypothetical protein